MSNKDSVQEIENNIMIMKIQDNKKNKNILKEILTNQKVTMINHTKIGNKTNFFHLKTRKNQSRIKKSHNNNNLEVS